MQIDKKSYKKYADARAKKSPCAKNCVNAFLYGGLICAVAQGLKELYMTFLKEKDAATLVSVTLIFIAALLTGIGVFDRIAKHAGAGTLVPITGFSNAVASSALDAKGDESAIIYPSQTNLHNSWGEYDSVQNKIGRRRGNHSELTIKLKLPHEGVG